MIVRARIVIRGSKGYFEELALVDTGASITLLDTNAAEHLGVKYLGRKMKLIVADGHEIAGELAIVDSLSVEGEELPGAHVLVIDFPARLSESLKSLGVSGRVVLGLSILEILGLVPNTSTGRVEKVGLYAI
ncbi:MAG: aspartyl protease family protein [Sulfolobales archaeon]